MAKKRGVVVKRPSKLEYLAMTSELECRHTSTADIQSRLRVLQFEAEELDKTIAAATGQLAVLRERRAKIAATAAGLTSVVAQR